MRWSWLNQMPYAAVPTTPTASALADATQSASRPNCAGDVSNTESTARLTPGSGSVAPDFGCSARLDIAAFSEFFRLTIRNALFRRYTTILVCSRRNNVTLSSSGDNLPSAKGWGGNTRMKTYSPSDRPAQRVHLDSSCGAAIAPWHAQNASEASGGFEVSASRRAMQAQRQACQLDAAPLDIRRRGPRLRSQMS